MSVTNGPAALPRCEFGEFEFDPASGELLRRGRRVRFAPQPARLLALLLQRPGQLVTREEIAQAIWGDTAVDVDQGLNFCIKQVRTALGDSAEAPRFVETVPKRGYRFVGSIPASPAAIPAAQAPAPRARRTTMAAAVVLMVAAAILGAGLSVTRRPSDVRTMIAVLPFENLSGDPTQGYLSDGFTDELITQLGRVNPDGLGVIARTSTARFRESGRSLEDLGRELGVSHVLDGTFRKSGNSVRISTQLVRVSDQANVWSEVYESDERDVLRLQDDIATAIAKQTSTRLAPAAGARKPVQSAAYDAYLKGRYIWNRRGPDVAVAAEHFREAIRLDPGFAPAYAGLGDCYLSQASIPDVFEKALDAANMALSLDPLLAEAWTTKATALLHRLEWTEAERAFRRALALDGSYVPACYFYGELLVARGRGDEATAQANAALALDPASPIVNHAAGTIAYYARDYDRAHALFSTALRLDPAHRWSRVRLGLVEERRGALDAALQGLAAGPAVRAAFALSRAGRAAEARRAIDAELGRTAGERDAFHLATAYAGLGDTASALQWLRRGIDRRVFDIIYTKAEPRFDELRGHPEFQAILERGGWR